jgi:hypothetical protein
MRRIREIIRGIFFPLCLYVYRMMKEEKDKRLTAKMYPKDHTSARNMDVSI